MRRVAPLLVGTILFAGLAAVPHMLVSRTQSSPDFVHFESAHVHPACLTQSGDRLLVVNTPDNRLSVFNLTAGPLSASSRIAEIPVGLEPVSVAALSDSEAWVVNHLSDDVSIVNLNTMHVRATLRVGDEPGDVVFAGTPTRAYVSVGQYDQVVVIDPASLATVATIAIGGRVPRALARTADGSKVYVALMEANNHTSIMNASRVPDDSIPQDLNFPKDTLNGPAPKTSFIVQQQGQDWYDFYGNLWNSKIKYVMTDRAVVEISTTTNSVTRSFGGWAGTVTRLGSENLGIAVSPLDGRIAVTNTRARNLLRFEPRLIGYLVETQFSSIAQDGTVNDRKLNPHINYNVVPGTQAEADSAIGIPAGVAYSSNGLRAYVTSLATNKLAVVNPYGGPLSTVKARVPVLEGPTGVVVDQARQAIYVVGRMHNQIQSVSSTTLAAGVPVNIGFDPTPNDIVQGRKFFYGGFTSGHGDQSCASCHSFGDTDQLGWDLGNPAGASQAAPAGQPDPLLQGFHPMKGPMVTQSLRGLPNTGLLHWRGDKGSLNAFNGAFVSLMGRADTLANSEMAAFGDFVLPLVFPPNPNRYLDNTLPDAPYGQPSALRGQDIFTGVVVQGDGKRCAECHSMTNGTNTLLVNHAAIQEPQDLKVPQLRNLYKKYGYIDQPGAINRRGFGYGHDGAVDTLFAFLHSTRFTFPNGDDDRRDLDAFLRCFGTGMAPAVGYQLTFDGANNAEPVALARVDTLRGQSDANNCDLIAKGRVNGQPRGWLYQGGNLWKSDKNAESPIATAALVALADLGSEVTVTGVPKGSGQRAGLDRDRDGYPDGDELDAGSDPGDPNSIILGVPGGSGAAFGLQAVRPNPFRSQAEVAFTLSTAGPVDLRIYDVLGREVRAIARGERFDPGAQRLVWDGRRGDGGQVGAGVYFVRLRLAGREWTKTIVRLR